MINIAFPVDIDRPLEDVFAYVTDPQKLPEWQPTTESVTVETAGPLRRGTRMREVRRAPMGRRVESLVEVSEYEPNQRFDLRIVDGPLHVDGCHHFEPTPTGTRINFVAAGQPTGAMRLAQPLLSRVLDRQFRDYYRRLKQVLEAA